MPHKTKEARNKRHKERIAEMTPEEKIEWNKKIAANARAYRKKMTEESRQKRRDLLKKYYWEDPKRGRERSRENYRKYVKDRIPTPKRQVANIKHKIKKFGLTLLDYYAAQSLGCEICRDQFVRGKTNAKSMCVDHCHTAEVFRGFICNSCNIALGKFQDSPDTLNRAIKYLLDKRIKTT
jgi:hypothetical protein